MGLMKAAQLAPDAVLLPTDFDSYRRYSRLFKAAVRAIAPLIQDNGIDEIYIDLTDVHPPRPDSASGEPASDPWWRAGEVAQSLREAVRAATGLTCSIGVAPNKLLAKMASELDKPDGLTLLRAEDVPRRIWPLPARKINGIGPKSRCAARIARASARSASSRRPIRRGSSSTSAARTARGCTTRRTVATSGPC